MCVGIAYGRIRDTPYIVTRLIYSGYCDVERLESRIKYLLDQSSNA